MFKDTLQELLEAELDENLGYEKYEYLDEPKIIIVMDILRKQFILPLEIFN